jgi:hypothetical protein
MHAAADREQLMTRAGDLRTVQRFRDHHHCSRDDRPVCSAIELDPAHVDVAVLRWQAFTGQTATLEGDNRPFADVAGERRPEKAI